MPLFDFRCKACGHIFEVLVRGRETPQCPRCQSGELDRQLPTFSLSTDERRAAAARQSRRQQVAKRQDALIAEEEYRQKHDKE